MSTIAKNIERHFRNQLVVCKNNNNNNNYWNSFRLHCLPVVHYTSAISKHSSNHLGCSFVFTVRVGGGGGGKCSDIHICLLCRGSLVDTEMGC